MAHTRLITLNASGGAFVAVSATQVTRRVEIIEDGSANGGTGQGTCVPVQRWILYTVHHYLYH